MKKSVILTIAAIYIFSIVIVGLIGINLKVYDEIEYTESITCINSNYQVFDPNDASDIEYINMGINGYILDFYSEGKIIEIKCKLEPSSISVNVLQFTIESSVATGEKQADGTYLVFFKERGDAYIYIKANDGSNKKLGILLTVI